MRRNRALTCFDRKEDDRLRHTVFTQDKVVFRQMLDNISTAIGDDSPDLYQFCCNSYLRCLRICIPLPITQKAREDQSKDCGFRGDMDAHDHLRWSFRLSIHKTTQRLGDLLPLHFDASDSINDQ